MEETVLTMSKGSVSQALKLLNYGGADIVTAFSEMLATDGPAAKKAMHRLADVLSAKDAEVLLSFFLEHLGDHLIDRARMAAADGNLASADRYARLTSEINEKIGISQAYNLDRKQTLLSILQSARG